MVEVSLRKGISMFTIGQFAQLTGLTVKALRHYDEKGLLTPVEIDAFSGYRRYGAGQVAEGATICVLRQVGLPLSEVKGLLGKADAIQAALTRFEAARRAHRAHEDAEIFEAHRVLSEYEDGPPAARRSVSEQAWVGFKVTLALDAPDARSEEFNRSFNNFFRAVYFSDMDPVGTWWMSFEAVEDEESIVTMWGIPVAKTDDFSALQSAVPEGAELIHGVLPARKEIAVGITGGMEVLTAPHPSALRLFDEDMPFGIVMRQVFTPTEDGMPHIELVADFPTTA